MCGWNMPKMVGCSADTAAGNGRGRVVGQEGSPEEVFVCAESYRPSRHSPDGEDGKGSFQAAGAVCPWQLEP